MWFEIVAGKDFGRKFLISHDSRFLQIGRHFESTVCLDSPTVAQQHAAFVCVDGISLECSQTDAGYRTRRNGDPVSPPFRVRDLDDIQCGEFVLRFRSR